MGTLRKLQSEIDRVLKKVAEGIQVFDDFIEQLHNTDNVNQKEKHEANLKSEIKKLQRYRDQVKTWSTSAEIKDKGPLVTARKDIERRMELFKVCEKESKTKAYSKEGLAGGRSDPRDKALLEMRDWFNTAAETLNTQIEEYEAELEELVGGKPKKGKPPPRLVHLEESVTRHRAHVLRVEQVLRLLDNAELTADDVEGSKDLLEDYLERCQEDFEQFADVDETYEDILEALESMSGAVVAAVAPMPGSSKPRDRDAKAEERERERVRAAAAAAKAALAAAGNTRLQAAAAEDGARARPAPSALLAALGDPLAAQGLPAPAEVGEAMACLGLAERRSPAMAQPASLARCLQQLASSLLRSQPEPDDAVWSRFPQRRRGASVPLPASYPTQRPAVFDNPALYERLDAETLFFAFYQQPGTRAQALAARELKRQAWRFHKQHAAWFQRHEEPKAGGQPGDDWEQGTYVYFDSTVQEGGEGSGWCYRLKQDFLFKYSALEDELTV